MKHELPWPSPDLLLTLFFLISGILMLPAINSSFIWNDTFIHISIGILTFVAVFYAFIIRKDFLARQKALLAEKWNEKFPNIDKSLKAIRSECKKEDRDYDELLKNSESLYQEVSDISLFKDEIDINKMLFKATLVLIFSIALFIYDSVINQPFIYEGIAYNVRLGGFIMTWMGLYFTLKIVTRWFLRFSKKE